MEKRVLVKCSRRFGAKPPEGGFETRPYTERNIRRASASRRRRAAFRSGILDTLERNSPGRPQPRRAPWSVVTGEPGPKAPGFFGRGTDPSADLVEPQVRTMKRAGFKPAPTRNGTSGGRPQVVVEGGFQTPALCAGRRYPSPAGRRPQVVVRGRTPSRAAPRWKRNKPPGVAQDVRVERPAPFHGPPLHGTEHPAGVSQVRRRGRVSNPPLHGTRNIRRTSRQFASVDPEGVEYPPLHERTEHPGGHPPVAVGGFRTRPYTETEQGVRKSS